MPPTLGGGDGGVVGEVEGWCRKCGGEVVWGRWWSYDGGVVERWRGGGRNVVVERWWKDIWTEGGHLRSP